MNDSVKKNKVSDSLDLLPIEEIVLFPQVILPFHISEKKHIDMIDDILSRKDRMFAVSTVRQDSKIKETYNTGVQCNIMKMLKLPDGSSQILVQGVKRIKIQKTKVNKGRLKVDVKILEENNTLKDDIKIQALISNLKKSIEKLNKLGKNIPNEFVNYLFNVESVSHFADLIATVLDITIDERQKYLEELDVKKRLEKANVDINKELNILSVGQQIQNKVSQKLKKNEKDYLLREQLKAIHQELGEVDDKTKEIEEIKQKLEKSNLPENVNNIAQKELKRLSRMHGDSAEGSVIRTYLEWITELPWSKNSNDNKDIKKAEKILEKSHFGLEKVKERILEFLAVQKLKNSLTGPILCFAGPPGVGKTSLGKAIADSLNKKYVRMSLGGLHDESEIRGHRRTYIGAMPGRILQGMKSAGVKNPVFVLDEIDKVSSDFRGDPSSALLEVLDPE
ncbi:MAG: LON peptidase substrate-binding domain-containing protein [Candidatus Muirbacterium halophilum]|nr:LON peptidase substrate-binding domain-containing protein [Candidatus Muirbacterium halophilum]